MFCFRNIEGGAHLHKTTIIFWTSFGKQTLSCGHALWQLTSSNMVAIKEHMLLTRVKYHHACNTRPPLLMIVNIYPMQPGLGVSQIALPKLQCRHNCMPVLQVCSMLLERVGVRVTSLYADVQHCVHLTVVVRWRNILCPQINVPWLIRDNESKTMVSSSTKHAFGTMNDVYTMTWRLITEGRSTLATLLSNMLASVVIDPQEYVLWLHQI